MAIKKWFDPNNVEHVKAFEHYLLGGNFVVDNQPRTYESGWQYDIIKAMAVAWMKHIMKGVKNVKVS